MTGYTVHTGSNLKFSNGWDRIFSGNEARKGTAKTASKKAAKTRKPAKRKSRG